MKFKGKNIISKTYHTFLFVFKFLSELWSFKNWIEFNIVIGKNINTSLWDNFDNIIFLPLNLIKDEFIIILKLKTHD